MTWRLAKSLEVLKKQINDAYPNRSKSSDGTIGDAAHATTSSDHNPWVRDSDIGVVTAIDLTHDPKKGLDSYKLAEILRVAHDPRIKYVISNGQIFSSQVSPWKWRPYHGSNLHNHHVHISVMPTKKDYDNTSPWQIGTVDTPLIDKPVIKEGDKGDWVAQLQKILGLAADGHFGPITAAAVKTFQKAKKLFADGVVGTYTWEALEKKSVSTDKNKEKK
jgi:hypothetical protein